LEIRDEDGHLSFDTKSHPSFVAFQTEVKFNLFISNYFVPGKEMAEREKHPTAFINVNGGSSVA